MDLIASDFKGREFRRAIFQEVRVYDAGIKVKRKLQTDMLKVGEIIESKVFVGNEALEVESSQGFSGSERKGRVL
jgi:hypothetical protein